MPGGDAMKNHHSIAAASLLGVLALTMSPRDALAHDYSWRSYSPTNCSVSTDSTGIKVAETSNINQLYDTGGGIYTLFCPVESAYDYLADVDYGDGAEFEATSNSLVQITGWANNNGWIAYACRTNADGTGGSCGSGTSATANSNNYLNISDMSAWTSGGTNDYFVKLYVGAKDGSNSINTFSRIVVSFFVI
jgi:hypothetical protein